jgi:hypothetical protein
MLKGNNHACDAVRGIIIKTQILGGQTRERGKSGGKDWGSENDQNDN